MPKVNLERDQLWNGTLYLAGECNIPDDLAQALGLSAKPPPEVETLPDAPVPTEDLPALTLLNSVIDASDLEQLPTVGKATAKVLFERRPEGGYESLTQAEEINADKSHIDWEAIALWEAE